jgi:outer membrane protein OmpA-like peptidoglycan-associated protein
MRIGPWAALSVAAAAVGCAGSQLSVTARQVAEMTRDARTAGAELCAPRQLALAETNTEFAERELAQGDYFRARDHLQTADENARAAKQLTVPAKCPALASRLDRDRDGLLDGVDKCPTNPEDRDGFEDEDGCPDPDNDKDGVADASDKCPTEAEDKDGFEDEDGCPEKDNDKDGIADASDKCPTEAEDKDGFEDEDGCPEKDNDKDSVADGDDKCPLEPGPPENGGCPKKYEHIVVTQEKIELRQKIFFETAKAVIMPRSYPLLSEIANVLITRKSMRVRIEGHTDTRGKRGLNMKLSQARADSVRAHLVTLGIDSSRMESLGFGPDQPIETNKTASGRERNRRVEFVITQQ